MQQQQQQMMMMQQQQMRGGHGTAAMRGAAHMSAAQRMAATFAFGAPTPAQQQQQPPLSRERHAAHSDRTGSDGGSSSGGGAKETAKCTLLLEDVPADKCNKYAMILHYKWFGRVVQSKFDRQGGRALIQMADQKQAQVRRTPPRDCHSLHPRSLIAHSPYDAYTLN